MFTGRPTLVLAVDCTIVVVPDATIKVEYGVDGCKV